MPVFQVDPAWLKLPNNWVLGVTSSITVDRHEASAQFVRLPLGKHDCGRRKAHRTPALDSMQTRFERVSGRHWLFSTGAKIDSPFFETSDVANLISGDGIQPSATVTYRETRPGRFFRSYSIAMNQSFEWNYGGDRQNFSTRPTVNITGDTARVG